MTPSAVNRNNHGIFVIAAMMIIVIVSLIITPLISSTYIVKPVYAQESDDDESTISSAGEFASRLLEGSDDDAPQGQTGQTSPAPIPDEETSPTPQIPPQPPLGGNETIDAAGDNRTGGSPTPTPMPDLPNNDILCFFFYPIFYEECRRQYWSDADPSRIPTDGPAAAEPIQELVLAAQNTNISISPKDTQLVSIADHVLAFAPTMAVMTNTSEGIEDGRIGLTYRLNETSDESEILVLSTRTDAEDNRYVIFEDLNRRVVSELIFDPDLCSIGLPESDPFDDWMCDIIFGPNYPFPSTDGQTGRIGIPEGRFDILENGDELERSPVEITRDSEGNITGASYQLGNNTIRMELNLPEDGNVTEIDFFIDSENLLTVGSSASIEDISTNTSNIAYPIAMNIFAREGNDVIYNLRAGYDELFGETGIGMEEVAMSLTTGQRIQNGTFNVLTGEISGLEGNISLAAALNEEHVRLIEPFTEVIQSFQVPECIPVPSHTAGIPWANLGCKVGWIVAAGVPVAGCCYGSGGVACSICGTLGGAAISEGFAGCDKHY